MQTKTKYEETDLKELQTISGKALPQAIKILRTLREGIFAAKTKEREKASDSGLSRYRLEEFFSTLRGGTNE